MLNPAMLHVSLKFGEGSRKKLGGAGNPQQFVQVIYDTPCNLGRGQERAFFSGVGRL